MSDSNKVQNIMPSKISTRNKIFLSSKIENCIIEVGPKVVKACSILENVSKFTNDEEKIVAVEMTKKQLKKFIELHEHFAEDDPMDKSESNWVEEFFSEMSDEEFKELCWKADYLDSQRFLNNAAFYLISKLQTMKIEDFQDYLQIVNDYTEDEKNAIKTEPLKYFTRIAVEQENVELESTEEHEFRNNEHVKVVFYPLQKNTKTEFIFQKQNFAFPKSLINFTFTTSKIPADLFFKLYSTCKYFFVTLKLLPCHRLRAGIWRTNNFQINYANEMIDLPMNCVKNINANFYICDVISVESIFSPRNLNILFKKIICHEIIFACIDNSKLTLTVSEFMFLFTRVQEVYLNLKVIDSNEKMIPLEELLNLLPNVQNFKYQSASPESYNLKTVQNIAKLKRNIKFNSFVLHSPPSHMLNAAEAFADLIKNHANLDLNPPACFQLIFDKNVQEEIISNFYSVLISIIDSWEIKSTKPQILLGKYGRILFDSNPFRDYFVQATM